MSAVIKMYQQTNENKEYKDYTISKGQPFYTAQGQYITLEIKGRVLLTPLAKVIIQDCLKVIE